MKAIKKIIIAASAIITFMLLLPVAVDLLADSLSTMGYWLLSFFAINPAVAIALGIMAGSDVRALWWLPLVAPAVFPLLFAVAIGELVADLYIYSAIYLLLGYAAELVAAILFKRGKGRE